MIRLSRMVLGAAFALGLVAVAATNARAAEPDKLLPADADTVVQVNIKQILDTDIIKKYALEQLKQALDGQDAKKLLSEIGLDPLKDIDKVVVGANVKGRTDTKFLMIVHGTFDPDKLYKAAEAKSKKDADRFAMIKDGNTVIFKYTPENGENPIYGTVVNDKTVVAGSDKKMIANALKAAEEGKKAPIKREPRRPRQEDGREVVGLRRRAREGEVRRRDDSRWRQHSRRSFRDHEASPEGRIDGRVGQGWGGCERRCDARYEGR